MPLRPYLLAMLAATLLAGTAARVSAHTAREPGR